MKTATVTLYVSELVFDIQNKAHLTGRSRDNAQDPSLAANMQASDDDNEQIYRSIGNAFAQLKTTLSEYLQETGTTGDNILNTSSEKLVLTLSVPENFNLAAINAVTAAAHQYLVSIALFDWFTITDKADAADYAKLASDAVDSINEAINKRVRPTYTAPKTNTGSGENKS
jgi:hypothetical protein